MTGRDTPDTPDTRVDGGVKVGGDVEEGRVVEAQAEIPASPAVVWKALTDADELARWFPLEAKVMPGPGGSVWMSWGGEIEYDGPIDIWEPERRLRLALPSGTLAIDYLLEAHGGGTLLRIVHSGFGGGAEWDDEVEATFRGWRFQLGSLAHYLHRHRGAPRRVAWARVLVDLPREERWERLLGPRGFLDARAMTWTGAGGRFSVRTATGDLLEGAVLRLDAPKELTATVENLNDALLRIQLDDLPLRGYRDVSIWLSTYELADDQVAAMQERWLDFLRRLFPEANLPG